MPFLSRPPLSASFLVLLLFLGTVIPAWAQKTAILSGKINNPVSDSVLLELYTVPGSYSGESHTVALANNGEFKLNLPVAEPMLGELVHGSESIVLFLQPNDKLEVKADAEDFISTTKMKGQGVLENQFLLQIERKFEEEEDYQVLPENIHKREKEFLRFLEERRQDQRKFLDKYLKGNQVSKAFQEYVQAQIEFSYANDRLTYVEVRKRVGDLPPTLSPDYYDYLKKVNLNAPGAIRNPVYLDFLNNYFQHKALQGQFGNLATDYYPILFSLAKQELQGNARDMMLARLLTQSFRFGSPTDSDILYLDFLKEAKNKTFLAHIGTQYKQFRPVGLGSMAAAFTLLSAKGDSVSLGSFKNKMVYLGFWRTHCSICTLDQQAYASFSAQLAPKDIVLLQVSVGEDLKPWKQAIAQQKLPGTHLYVPDLAAKVLKDYDVKSYPAYFLIAPDGTLISTNARRPGHSEGAREIALAVDNYRKSAQK